MDAEFRILIVDDSKIIREAMEKHFADAGYWVESVGTAHEALMLNAKKRFDLFLIDVVMPDVNGLTLLKELKINDNTYEAIMVTGHESLDDAATAMELGAFSYLRKPVAQKELLDHVRKALVMVQAKKNRFGRLRLLEASMSGKTRELENAAGLLETQAQRLDAIVNSMGDGLLAVDCENAVVLLNSQAEKILDIRFGECAGQRLDRIQGLVLAPQLRDALRCGGGPVESRAVSCSIEVAGNGVRQFTVTISDVFDKNGKKTGILALFSDESEKISAEYLRKSFLTILAHELRTPLTVIMNYFPVLVGQNDSSADRKEAVKDMRSAALRMKKLIDTIMSLALLSDPAITIQKGEADVYSIVNLEMSAVEETAERMLPRINVESRAASGIVHCDPTLVKIIIACLLSNAVKFNKDDGIVTICIEDSTIGDQCAIALTFRDQGAGLSESSKNRLFGVLFQGEDHLTRNKNGIGSGLFLAHRASRLLGGTLEMRENADCGMSFTVTLPAR